MENVTTPNKSLQDNSAQTDPESNKGKGQSALRDEKYPEFLTAYNPTPEYRQKLLRVFNEEFIAEKSKNDLALIIDLV